MDRTIRAEWEASRAERESNVPARRSKDLTDSLDQTRRLLSAAVSRESILCQSVDELQVACSAAEEKLAGMELSVPTPDIAKKRDGS